MAPNGHWCSSTEEDKVTIVVAASSISKPAPVFVPLSVVLTGLNPTSELFFCCENGDVRENVTLIYSCCRRSGPSPGPCVGASPGPGATPACCHKLVGTCEKGTIMNHNSSENICSTGKKAEGGGRGEGGYVLDETARVVTCMTR